LSKIERGHAQDLLDRYPAIDPASFRRSVEAFLASGAVPA